MSNSTSINVSAWCKLWQIHWKFQWGLIIACKWVIQCNISMYCLHGCGNVEKDTLKPNSMFGTFSDRSLWSSFFRSRRRSSLRWWATPTRETSTSSSPASRSSWRLPTATRSWSWSTWIRLILPNSIGSTRTTSRLSTRPSALSISQSRRRRQRRVNILALATRQDPLRRRPLRPSQSRKKSKPPSRPTVLIKARNEEI